MQSQDADGESARVEGLQGPVKDGQLITVRSLAGCPILPEADCAGQRAGQPALSEVVDCNHDVSGLRREVDAYRTRQTGSRIERPEETGQGSAKPRHRQLTDLIDVPGDQRRREA